MAKGKRTPEEEKMKVAQRVANGEDAGAIAEELGFSVYTINDWGRQYKPKKRRGVKKKVVVQPDAQNTRVSPFDAENKGLREENQRLRNLLLDEILRNR